MIATYVKSSQPLVYNEMQFAHNYWNIYIYTIFLYKCIIFFFLYIFVYDLFLHIYK